MLLCAGFAAAGGQPSITGALSLCPLCKGNSPGDYSVDYLAATALDSWKHEIPDIYSFNDMIIITKLVRIIFKSKKEQQAKLKKKKKKL